MSIYIKRFDALSPREVYEILAARLEVFAVEQGICCQDADGVDYDALHVFSVEDGRVTAYCRAFYTDDSHKTVAIGRVLTRTHGKGHGRALMEAALAGIARELPSANLMLHAQTHARGFYEKFGFTVTSEPFMEDGILHVEMKKSAQKENVQ